MSLQTADQLLARADAAKALAEEAAKRGRDTLQEANDILNNLNGRSGRHSSQPRVAWARPHSPGPYPPSPLCSLGPSAASTLCGLGTDMHPRARPSQHFV